MTRARILAAAVLAALTVSAASRATRPPALVIACLEKAGARIVPLNEAPIGWVYSEIIKQVFWDMNKLDQSGVGISIMFTSDTTSARGLVAKFLQVGTTHGQARDEIRKALGRAASVVWFEDQARPVTARQRSLLRSCVG